VRNLSEGEELPFKFTSGSNGIVSSSNIQVEAIRCRARCAWLRSTLAQAQACMRSPRAASAAAAAAPLLLCERDEGRDACMREAVTSQLLMQQSFDMKSGSELKRDMCVIWI
jgi:hypothetical protein